jgi:acyl-CoA dehydrogenase
VNRAWTPAALAFEESLRAALAGLGGVDLARQAEADPAVRSGRLAPVLQSMGVLELDAFSGDDEEASAAVLAVRTCGAVVAPWPIARALAVPADARQEADGLYVIDGDVSHLDHADLFDRPVVLPLRGGGARAIAALGGPAAAPLDPFRVAVAVAGRAPLPVPGRVAAMSAVLDAFWVAGALATVTRLAVNYAVTRRQFGRSIASFGEIRWRIADMVVAADGMNEIAAYTWFLVRRERATLADALALRVAMQDAADVVLRNGHQVLGAIGLCEEHDVAVIDRHLTPALLRSAGSRRTADALLEAVNHHGFDAIFPVPPRPGLVPEARQRDHATGA